MTPKPKFKGCGQPSKHIVFRGTTRRLFMCPNCRPNYEGSGKVADYSHEHDEQTRPPGVFTGPLRYCGESVE